LFSKISQSDEPIITSAAPRMAISTPSNGHGESRSKRRRMEEVMKS
jgi:hypothetical protein